VIYLLITVSSVLLTEKPPLFVTVMSVSMLPYILMIVKNVIGNVKPVKENLLTVPSVKVIESALQNVSVQKEPSKDIKPYHSISVHFVTINVSPALVKLISVTDVPKTEFIFLSVLAQWVNTKLLTKLTAQNVTLNVDLVSPLPITVSNVLKD
jgi:hypothetical protein